MSMSSTTTRIGLTQKVSGYFGRLSRDYAQYKTYRTTLDELERLTDRELADLGIARSTLRSVAYKAAYDG